MNELITAIHSLLAQAEPCQQLSSAIAESLGHFRRIGVKGLRSSSLPAVISWLTAQAQPAPSMVFVITGNHMRASEIVDDLEFFSPHGQRPYYWSLPEVLPYDNDDAILDDQINHLELLNILARLKNGEKFDAPVVAVTCVEAMMWRVPSHENTERARIIIHWGEEFVPETFAAQADKLGYQRVSTVEVRGEYAIRGGIVDIFPVTAESPIRIDLFGNEIESMRHFDVNTQRTNKDADELEEVQILPASERVAFGDLAEGAAHLEPLPCIPDLLPPDALVVLDSTETWMLHEERFKSVVKHRYEEHGEGKASPEVLFAGLKELEKALSHHTQIHHSLILESAVGRTITFETESFETVKPDFLWYSTRFMEELKSNRNVLAVCDNDGQAKRLAQLLTENEIPAEVCIPEVPKFSKLPVPLVPNTGKFGCVVVTVGDMNNGFSLQNAQLMMVTDREIFGRYKHRHLVRKTTSKTTTISDPREIKPGDYVVHIDHGIAIFSGIRTIEYNGKTLDVIELEYAEHVTLKVPIEKINLIHKYSAGENETPKLDYLGSKRWSIRRRKGQEEIERYARELAELYARRSMTPGTASKPDNDTQRAFEDSFLYNETADQLRAIEDVKRDMMSKHSMDRLIVGDVGYGKTEVAIRAAFKAIQDGKQVALLCPTTVLCQQHYHNFRERFASYPIRIEMISRFKTATEIRKLKKDIAAGEVQMVVGTHAVLSKSMIFKDLGLLIVDEEHRFGVAQKERLRELRRGTDCLTLTATPIPRTLYMSLSGVRDMSLINTPPADRHPIRTRVVHWDRDVIEEAILRELNRGGQVFYIHNRVQTIYAAAKRIKEIVPQARIVVGHGQMNEEELENVMLEFVDGKYDILVSTTIIESGMDIPNVNTIIMDRADMFGLAQIYQLRGRVGRQSRQAYAYLLLPNERNITEQAVQRINAIQEFSGLGAGFNLAMRDMEIRGVGNLLGKEQHGTVCDIGFELYCHLLEEAIERIKAQVQANGDGKTDTRPMLPNDVEIRWQVSAAIPADYVPEETQRISLYKRIADARKLADLQDIAEEIADRFGRKEVRDSSKATVKRDLPDNVDNLLNIARIRVMAARVGIVRVVLEANGFKIIARAPIAPLANCATKIPRKNDELQIYCDDPYSLQFAFKDWERRKKLVTCVTIFKQLIVNSKKAR